MVTLKTIIILITMALLSPGMQQANQPDDTAVRVTESIANMVKQGQPTIVAGAVVGITVIIMFALLIITLVKIRHARTMSMIAKGIYTPKPTNWNHILKLLGIFILCLTPGVVLAVILLEGLIVGLKVGSVMVILGIGILAFRYLARDLLPSPSLNSNHSQPPAKNENQIVHTEK